MRLALENVPADYALVLRLRFFDEMPLKRIGAFLGAPLSTVKWRIHRGKQLLREQVELLRQRGEKWKAIRELAKLINVLRRIARAASHAAWSRDPDAARFCALQYNKVLARMTELEPAVRPLFVAVPESCVRGCYEDRGSRACGLFRRRCCSGRRFRSSGPRARVWRPTRVDRPGESRLVLVRGDLWKEKRK